MPVGRSQGPVRTLDSTDQPPDVAPQDEGVGQDRTVQIRLATRGSRLALAQSAMIADALRELGADVELVPVKTLGDVSTAPLSSMGGVGVFVAAVREAVLAGVCDLAVHSLKDLPTTPAEGLTLGAVPEREDPRDALCARDGLGLWGLPRGAKIGTGSPRRAAQLRAARWDLEIVDIRGNVDTRLGRVGADLDAVVLAAAGLNRLGRADAITEYFEPEVMLPAPAQGALALECRHDDAELLALLAHLDHVPTRIAVEAERELMRLVEAGCAAPFGALAEVVPPSSLDLIPDTPAVLFSDTEEVTRPPAGGWFRLRARLAAPDGMTTLTKSIQFESGPGGLSPRAADARMVGRIGELVATMARNLAPLVGLRVLMPPSRLAEAVALRGAQVTTASFTRHTTVTGPQLAERIGRLAAGDYDWLVLTSARTVAALRELGVDLAAVLNRATKVAAVGPATAAAAREAGVHVDLLPTSGSGGADLAAAFPDQPGGVLVPGAADPAAGLDAALTARGFRVDRVAVYRTDAVEGIDDEVRLGWPAGFDAFVVTAPSVVRAAAGLLDRPGPPVVALGDSSAAAARAAGFTVVATAAVATPAGLVNALATLRKEDR